MVFGSDRGRSNQNESSPSIRKIFDSNQNSTLKDRSAALTADLRAPQGINAHRTIELTLRSLFLLAADCSVTNTESQPRIPCLERSKLAMDILGVGPRVHSRACVESAAIQERVCKVDELRLRGIEQLKFLLLKRGSIGTDPDRRVDTHALAPSPESYRRRVSPFRKAYCQGSNTAQSSIGPDLYNCCRIYSRFVQWR